MKTRHLRGAVSALMGLLASLGLALAMDWSTVGVTASGAEWQIRRGTAAESAGGVYQAVFRMSPAEGAAFVLQLQIERRHCGQPAGELQMRTLDGALLARAVFKTGDGQAASVLAEALGKAVGK